MKLDVMANYLETNAAEYVLFIDADVVIWTRPGHDTLEVLIKHLEALGKDVMYADEDWVKNDKGEPNSKGRLNGGMIFAKNTPWAARFFRNISAYHSEILPRCTSNEQLCMRTYVENNHNNAQDRVVVASGNVFNRHPNSGISTRGGNGKWPAELMPFMDDPRVEIVHSMGGAKGATKYFDVPALGLCQDQLCLNLTHCDLQSKDRRKTPNRKRAIVMIDGLSAPPGEQHSQSERMAHHRIKAMLHVAKQNSADPVVLVPSDAQATHPLTAAEKRALTEHKIRIVQAKWSVPPSLSPTAPGSGECGASGYLVAHALGMLEYGTVLVIGADATVRGDFAPAFRCGESGRVLSTSGPMAPTSDGFLMLNPSRALSEAVRVLWAQDLSVVWQTEAAGGVGFPRSECGAGLVWALLYSNQNVVDRRELPDPDSPVQRARAAKLKALHAPWEAHDRGDKPRALQLDRCIWNRHAGDAGVCARYNQTCSSARVVRGSECEKTRGGD